MTIIESKVTGVMIQYYMICKRKLWFYINQINMNYDNDDISIGKSIHENSFKRKKKEYRVDNVVFDFVENKGELTIFEVKKSSKLKLGSKYQLYYYLYILKQSGYNPKGVLVFPKEKKRESIEITESIEKEIENIIEDIIKIAEQHTPPKDISKKFCNGCSFYELCKI